MALSASVLLIPTACGDSSEKDPLPPGDGGHRGGSLGTGGTAGSGAKGGSGGKSGSGGEGGEDPGDALAPAVRITSPANLRHPDDGTVLVGAEVEVVCEVRQSRASGSEPVDKSTVVVELFGVDDEPIGDPQPGTETETPGEFVAPFILTEVPNGKVSFRCTASDTATPEPHVGSATSSSFVDKGPLVEITSPLEDSAYSLLQAVPFAFRVSPDPLVDDDPSSEIDTVSLEVLGRDIELTEEDGEYRASVNLADTSLFPDAPDTVPVVIRASNVRVPEAGERVRNYSFVLDSRGPTITITDPQDEDIRGGEVPLRFTVSDDLTEVDPLTVSVTINDGDPVLFDEVGSWSRVGSDFVYRFDTTAIDGSVAQATINVDAKDIAGNKSPGQAMVLFLDNQPPIVDLDPPYVREAAEAATGLECTHAFDPVGDDAANDLDGIRAAQRFRALVWADTNKADGQTIFFQSPTDEESVFLYLRDRPSSARPLLIDTDGDDVCDEIASTGLTDVDLHPMRPGGASWFGGLNDEPPDAPVMPSDCHYTATPGMKPDTLCTDTSDMWRTMAHPMDGKPPVVFALGSSLNGVGAACSGIDWEIGGSATEGWICVAGRAKDVVGNVGVSRPLRLCYDDGLGAPADCSAPPPSCTDGCTIKPWPTNPQVGPFGPKTWVFKP